MRYKQYKHKFLYSFIYVWTFVFEIGLIVAAYFSTRYYMIFIPIVFIIFLINIYAYIRQLQSSYVITDDGLEKWRKETAVSQFPFVDVVSIRETKMYYEITVRFSNKVRTQYLTKLLTEFDDMKQKFEQRLKDQNKEVLFF